MVASYPYVHEDVDRHGNVRVYFRRRKGAPKIRMHDRVGSEAFDAQYRKLLAEADIDDQALPEDPKIIVPQTYRWLCVKYLGSDDYKALELTTQATRRRLLESTYKEPVHPGAKETYATFPLGRMTPKAIRVLRDRKKDKRGAANDRLKAVRAVFAWAMEESDKDDGEDLISSNPARDVKQLPGKTSGHHTWTVGEVEQYEKCHPIGTKARLAMALFRCLGLRISDVVRVGKQHNRKGWIKLTLFKNRNRTPVTIEVPVLPELQAVIDASPTGDLTYLVTEFGLPFSTKGFGNKLRVWCDEAELPHCSAHGIRKAAATMAAENGATTHQLMAIFGWLTLEEAERYTRAARRKRMAGQAMELLRGTKSD